MFQHKAIPVLSRLRHLLRRRRLCRKDRITLAWMASIIPVCCIHQSFSKAKVVNGFLLINYPLEAYWYVKFMCSEIAWVMISVVVVRSVTKGLKPFTVVFSAYCIYNLIMFFVNCNSVNYYYIPLIIIAFLCNKIYS